MKLLVLGATGGTGSEVVKQGLAAGHTITAFARHPENITLQDPRLATIKGDAKDERSLVAAMQGQDAVIVALGPRSMKDFKELTTVTTKNIVTAMQQTNVKRVILMSSFMALPSRQTFGSRLATRISKGMSTDKIAGGELLRGSGLSWTIVYPPRLTNGPKTGQFRVVPGDEKLGLTSSISRADVADVMLTLLSDPSAMGKDIAVTTKPTKR